MQVKLPQVSCLAAILVGCLSCSCAGPKQMRPPPKDSKTVHVVHKGWHAALVVQRADIPPAVWPAHQTAPPAKYLEVGWGDNEGYRFPWTFRIVVLALFWPTPSVLLVRGFDEPVIEEFGDKSKEILAVQVSAEGFSRMCAYFQKHYQLDQQGRPIPLGSDFYVARGSYHAFQNSNHWTARALREAGCPITSFYAIHASNVMFQTHRFGTVLSRR